MTIVHRFKLKYISKYGIYYKHVGLTIPPTRILPQLRTMMKSIIMMMMMMMMMPGNK